MGRFFPNELREAKSNGPAPSSASAPAPKNRGACRDISTSCFKCGQNGQFIRECRKNRQGSGNGRNRAQSSSVAPPDRVAPREATLGTDREANRLYAITSHEEQDNSPDIVIGMIKVFTFDVDALLDPGASLSFVTPYIAMRFDIIPEQLLAPFGVSTPVGLDPRPCPTGHEFPSWVTAMGQILG
ncbi:uncharacterized protein LOC125842814 [Solanum stenotomum]|uniref:uncharacterized protein LOC125842814 n=1 Tax=Solanum stenotomum TaxID=172797 RepID=UPI0020D07F98|nr:uncharacterized protein LOC125842814 [Solanum stenotomum]